MPTIEEIAEGDARLLKLAEFLKKLDRSKFSISNVVTEFDAESKCGSVCCAIGWCPVVFPDICEWSRMSITNAWFVKLINRSLFDSFSFIAVANNIFHLETVTDEAEYLFGVFGWWRKVGARMQDFEITPAIVADRICDFVASGRKFNYQLF